jgi:undecaprenyl-diphosphatase
MTNIFTFFYNLSSYAWVGQSALLLSYPFAYASITIILLWAIMYSKRRMFTFNLLFLSLVFSWLAANLLKIVFHTSRPFTTLGIVPLYMESTYSFPSSHAAIFASLALSLYFVHKRFGLLFIVIALLIGLSRIVIGVHYPVDVISGWLLGGVVSFGLIQIFKKV